MSLKRCDYLTRAQLQKIHRLGGERNANRVLNGMSEYLNTFRHGLEKVYYLSKEGRQRIGCEVVRKKTPHIEHYLLRNQLWIVLGCPHSWENEIKVTVGDVSLVCDAKFMSEKKDILVEVDISQPMATNKTKIDKYKRIKEMTGNEFHLLWVTEIESRKTALKKLMGDMPGRVFTAKEIY